VYPYSAIFFRDTRFIAAELPLFDAVRIWLFAPRSVGVVKSATHCRGRIIRTSSAFPIDRGRSHSSKVPPMRAEEHNASMMFDVIPRHY
jgi:hypothetical protein